MRAFLFSGVLGALLMLWLPLAKAMESLPVTPSAASPNATNQTTNQIVGDFFPHQGALIFNAKSLTRNLPIGDYTLNWVIHPQDYSVKTSLFPKGLLSAFISYYLREISAGNIHKGELVWQSYEFNQVEKKAPYIFETVKRQGERTLVFSMRSDPVQADHEVMDIPTGVISLMRTFSDPSLPMSWSKTVDMFTSRRHAVVTLKREADEILKLPMGTFNTRVVNGEADQLKLKIWFDTARKFPIQVIFTNSRGEHFELLLQKILHIE